MQGINEQEFEKARKRIHALVDETLLTCFTNTACDLIHDAEMAKTYHNLTGNTLTSYAVGIYKDKILRAIIAINDVSSVKPPTRRKISRGNGKGIVIVTEYDTGERVIIKKANLLYTDGEYGLKTTMEFLDSFTPSYNGWCLCMSTGTEYSEYLEAERHLNVLTGTAKIAPSALMKNLIPIK